MSLVPVLLCVSWLALVSAWSTPQRYSLEDAELHFEHFIQKYGRNYANESEKQTRFAIFKEHLEKLNRLNEESDHAEFGITQFSDMSEEEFASKLNCLHVLRDTRRTSEDIPCKFVHDEDIDYNDAPESFDWRDHGVVAPVKNQLHFGSCYAFSAIGNIESQYAIKHKELVRLSEQQIVDCDKVDEGCQGGFMNTAIRSLIEQGGSESEADYPYNGTLNTCRFDANKVKVKIDDCQSFNLTLQEKVKQLLYHHGPISIGIKSSGFMFYTKGIIADGLCDIGPINHGVLLVGYGSGYNFVIKYPERPARWADDIVAIAEGDTPYWVAKNSWGTAFGEDGYFRMHRGETALSCSMMNDDMTSASVT